MNRKQLLEQNLTEEKNVIALVDKTTTADTKFMKREIRNFEDQIEDGKEKLQERLSQPTPIDKSVIEVLYAAIKTAEANLENYKAFEKDFLN